MKRTNIYLEQRQAVALDKLAADEGISRAELVRRIIDAALGNHVGSLERDPTAIRASAGVLQDSESKWSWRAVDDRQRHLAKIWNSSE